MGMMKELYGIAQEFAASHGMGAARGLDAQPAVVRRLDWVWSVSVLGYHRRWRSQRLLLGQARMPRLR